MPMKRIGSPSLRAIATTMPPFAVPSSLVSTRPVTPIACVELHGLRERVLPLVGIEHQQHLVRRGRRRRAGSRASPSSALPSDATGCAAGRRYRRAARRSPRARADCSASKTTAPGSAPACCATNARAGALGPDLQLLDRRGAEGIARGEHARCWPAPGRRAASLPMVVVLPEPFTPTTRITKGCCAASITSGCAQGARISVTDSAQRGDQRVDVGELLARHALRADHRGCAGSPRRRHRR